MNYRILAGVVVIMAFGFAAAGGVFAYFSDVANSEGNTFQTGNLDLKLSNTSPAQGAVWKDNVYHTWDSPINWAPGENFEDVIYFKNTGNVDGMILLVDLKPRSGSWNSKLARNVIVEIGGTNWSSGGSWINIGVWSGGDGSLDEAIDLDYNPSSPTKWDFYIFEEYTDVTGDGLTGDDTYSGTLLGPNEVGSFGMRFTLDEDVMNDLQDTSLVLDVEFALLQHAGPVARENLPSGSVDLGWNY